MTDNKNKSQHGMSKKRDLLELLAYFERSTMITHCSVDYRRGYAGFDNNQFYFPFCIELNDGRKWIVSSTTSIRHDRINIQQWNAFHLKRIDPTIECAIIAVPDEIIISRKEYQEMIRLNDRILKKQIFSSLDLILTVSQLKERISNNG